MSLDWMRWTYGVLVKEGIMLFVLEFELECGCC
jgi:hypothetical protein